MKKHYIIPLFVPHKGCPHDCVFCNQKHITGREADLVDASFVEMEIEKYLETIPDKDRFLEVSFFGGSFTGLPMGEQESLLYPAKRALESGKIDAIRLSTRPDYIDDNILKLLKMYNVSIIELGVQSMDNEVLLKSNRGHTKEDVYKACSLIKNYGFTLGLQMMVGLPGDCEEKDLYTADEFIRIKPDMVRIYPALVIKDTYMEYMYRRGEYLPLSLDESVKICAGIYLKFEKESINIIRIGLQPTDNISPGKDLVAGPFHPAYRELVESRILNDMLIYLIHKCSNRIGDLRINEKTISKLYSDKKRYFTETLNKLELSSLKVLLDNNLPLNSIMLKCGENSLTMSIKDYSLIK